MKIRFNSKNRMPIHRSSLRGLQPKGCAKFQIVKSFCTQPLQKRDLCPKLTGSVRTKLCISHSILPKRMPLSISPLVQNNFKGQVISLSQRHWFGTKSPDKKKLAQQRENQKKEAKEKKKRLKQAGMDSDELATDDPLAAFDDNLESGTDSAAATGKRLPPPIPPKAPLKSWELLYQVPDRTVDESSWFYSQFVPPFDETSINKVFNVNKEEKARFFPEGFAGFKVDEEALGEGNVGFLIRKEAVDLIQNIREAQKNRFRIPIRGENTSYQLAHLIGGNPGVGKSAILNTLVYWARNNGWLVVFIPSFDEPGKQLRIFESERERGTFDQLKLAIDFLTQTLTAHRDKLEKLPVRLTDLELTIETIDSEPKNLAELLQHGIDNPDSACDVVFRFRRELNEVDEFPVLIVVDNISQLWNRHTRLNDPYGKNPYFPQGMPYRKFSFGRIFRDYQYPGLKNGVQVSAVTHKMPARFFLQHFETEKPLTMRTIKPYTMEEYEVLNRFYDKVNFFAFSKLPQTKTREYVYYLNGGVGAEIFRYSALAF